jgi:hypothetical protein
MPTIACLLFFTAAIFYFKIEQVSLIWITGVGFVLITILTFVARHLFLRKSSFYKQAGIALTVASIVTLVTVVMLMNLTVSVRIALLSGSGIFAALMAVRWGARLILAISYIIQILSFTLYLAAYLPSFTPGVLDLPLLGWTIIYLLLNMIHFTSCRYRQYKFSIAYQNLHIIQRSRFALLLTGAGYLFIASYLVLLYIVPGMMSEGELYLPAFVTVIMFSVAILLLAVSLSRRDYELHVLGIFILVIGGLKSIGIDLISDHRAAQRHQHRFPWIGHCRRFILLETTADIKKRGPARDR